MDDPQYRRVITCRVNLSCGHAALVQSVGYYPAALRCPACPDAPPSWVSALVVDTDQAVLMPAGQTPPLVVSPLDDAHVADPSPWRDYTIGVALDDRDGVYEYVVHASLGEAVTLAARVTLADQQLDVRALLDVEPDGLPCVHVLWARTGAPVHPEDTPGLAWTDLRAPQCLSASTAQL